MLLLTACAKSPVLPPETSRLPERVELSSTPFFAQSAYQCGPAALATMLNQRGVTTSPGLLQDRVYIPGREGSLQVEMVAAARAHDELIRAAGLQRRQLRLPLPVAASAATRATLSATLPSLAW